MKAAKEYHLLDCTSLLEALLNFNEMMVANYAVDITCAYTISGLSKKVFLKQYYNPK